MNSLSNDTKLKQEIEFEEKVRSLMAQLQQVIEKTLLPFLIPDNKLSSGGKTSKTSTGTKRARKVQAIQESQDR